MLTLINARKTMRGQNQDERSLNSLNRLLQPLIGLKSHNTKNRRFKFDQHYDKLNENIRIKKLLRVIIKSRMASILFGPIRIDSLFHLISRWNLLTCSIKACFKVTRILTRIHESEMDLKRLSQPKNRLLKFCDSMTFGKNGRTFL